MPHEEQRSAAAAQRAATAHEEHDRTRGEKEVNAMTATPSSRDEAASTPCRRHDPDLWFAESPADVERAKTLCADCPLRAACLAVAVDRGEPWGVWGGELFVAGRIVARKRPRGRPRKHPVAA